MLAVGGVQMMPAYANAVSEQIFVKNLHRNISSNQSFNSSWPDASGSDQQKSFIIKNDETRGNRISVIFKPIYNFIKVE